MHACTEIISGFPQSMVSISQPRLLGLSQPPLLVRYQTVIQGYFHFPLMCVMQYCIDEVMDQQSSRLEKD
jgi:hypothetical protein